MTPPADDGDGMSQPAALGQAIGRIEAVVHQVHDDVREIRAQMGDMERRQGETATAVALLAQRADAHEGRVRALELAETKRQEASGWREWAPPLASLLAIGTSLYTVVMFINHSPK